ncbi:MAG: hypothetical protein SXG53_27530 [Pseudomonadota bacterium]|nr:hypothetical protein [Pseudomonadota bacterium]
MAIGIRELMLLSAFAVAVIVAGAAWFFGRSARGATAQRVQRPVADRLTELQSLRQAGQISADEYEKQRASIISGV